MNTPRDHDQSLHRFEPASDYLRARDFVVLLLVMLAAAAVTIAFVVLALLNFA